LWGLRLSGRLFLGGLGLIIGLSSASSSGKSNIPEGISKPKLD